MEKKHTISELHQMQSSSLKSKVAMTKARISGWVEEYGEDNVYISFSGGKDSTVLLHIARQIYPNLKAAFVDTGLEYPEIREFVKTFPNVDWLRTKMNFREVIETYGYPFISKEVSDRVDGARKYLKAFTDRQTDRQTLQYAYAVADLIGVDRRKDKKNPAYQRLLTGNIPSVDTSIPNWWRYAAVMDKTTTRNGYKSMYSIHKYKFFLDAPFNISAKCCNVMKKSPAHKYAKETGRKPITAQMASESRLRTSQWLKNGCNGFDMKSPISNPMSFWTEQDVLLYIKQNKLPICSVYGDIVIDYEAEGQLEGQMCISDYGMFDEKRQLLKTTGCKRTGCMYCGFGCHLEGSPNRFEKMKETHPKQYDYIMRKPSYKTVVDPLTLKQKKIFVDGLNYKEVIDWINKNGNMDIKY